MAIINLDKYLGNVRNRIAGVGVELEGGWTTPPTGMKVITDGSVFSGGTIRIDRVISQHPRFKYGEVPGPVLEPAAIARWITLHHPDTVDETCGMHVHMSFKDAFYYELLLNPDFMDTTAEYLTRWALAYPLPQDSPFWRRIRGDNTYCRKTYAGNHQVMAKSKDYNRNSTVGRYTFFNYCWIYKGTIECRVLPMFSDPAHSVSAIHQLMDITNATIVALRSRKKRLGDSVSMSLVDSFDEIDHVVL